MYRSTFPSSTTARLRWTPLRPPPKVQLRCHLVYTSCISPLNFTVGAVLRVASKLCDKIDFDIARQDVSREERKRKHLQTEIDDKDSAIHARDGDWTINLVLPHELGQLKRDGDLVDLSKVGTVEGHTATVNALLRDVPRGDDAVYSSTYEEYGYDAMTKAAIPYSYVHNAPGADTPQFTGPRIPAFHRKPILGADTSEWFRVRSRVYHSPDTPQHIELDQAAYKKLATTKGQGELKTFIDDSKHIAESVAVAMDAQLYVKDVMYKEFMANNIDMDVDDFQHLMMIADSGIAMSRHALQTHGALVTGPFFA